MAALIRIAATSLRERMLKLAVLVFRRIKYYGFSGLAVLIEVVALDVLVLNH
jgi:hypothetical protein